SALWLACGLGLSLVAAFAIYLVRRDLEPHAVGSSRERGVPLVATVPLPTRMRLPTGDALVATPGAQFELVRADSIERTVRLDRGSAVFDVAPLREGQAFVVMTPHAQVRVRGTVFSVEVTRDRTAVRVFEGGVSVNREGGGTFSLRPSQSFASDG